MTRFRKRASMVVAALCLAVAGCSQVASNHSPSAKTISSVASVSFSPSYYGQFSNGLPTSSSFFPIAIWDQSVSGGDVPAPSTNQAQQMRAEGININEGEDSNSELPAALAAACAQGVYMIGGNAVTASTVPSLMADANTNPSCAKYLVGYDTGDEGCTSTPETVIPQVHSADPTRMAEWGQSGFFPNDQSAACKTAFLASDLPSADVYEVTNTYLGSACNIPGKQSDCLWGYGLQTDRMVSAAAGTGKPIWVDVESGTDDLGASETQGACNTTTNLCPQGNEQRATPEQVNSAAWLTLVNGANGIIWFCHDSQTSSDACLGGGPNGDVSTNATSEIPANLTYVDATIKGFAQELNSQTVSGVTVSSSNSATPVDEMTKVVGGNTYLFVEADRAGGSTNVTYTVPGTAGDTASLVYDSAAQYDPSISEEGGLFALNGSGQFTDTLTGDTGNTSGAVSYQVKVYEIQAATGTTTTTVPATTSTTTAPTTTTLAPTTTTLAPTTTTTTTPPVVLTVSCSGWLNTSVNPQKFTPPCTFSGKSGIPYHTTITCTGPYTVGHSTFTLTCKT